jgi:hypothetical protein
MPKRKLAPSWTNEDKQRAIAIITEARELLKQRKQEALYSNRELPLSETLPHTLHMEACRKIFGVTYVDERMKGVRSYISHIAAETKARKKREAFLAFLKENLPARIEELQNSGGLHPEDEAHLVIHS